MSRNLFWSLVFFTGFFISAATKPHLEAPLPWLVSFVGFGIAGTWFAWHAVIDDDHPLR